MKKVVIFGGTGFLGRSLAGHLRAKGWTPVLVARHRPAELEFPFERWDGRNLGTWTGSLEGALAVVNFAGKSVDCRKTPDNCDLILRSRVEATRAIGAALEQVSQRPKVWIQMSTAHIYGDPPEVPCTETSALGYGLAPHVGRAWEQSFQKAKPKDMRGFILRTSFVIGRLGGALPMLKRLASWGLGGKVGHGEQGMSWIHEDDLNTLISTAIENSDYSGIVVASAPNPVSQANFMRKLRQEMGIPLGLPAPAWLVRLGARWILNTDAELILYGRYVYSQRLPAINFSFKYPELSLALGDLLKDS